MNIDSINRIRITGNVDGYVETMLNKANADVNRLACFAKSNVIVAQKGDRIFVNSGTITSSFDYKKMKNADEFKRNIINNIVANKQVSQKGLKAGFAVIV